MLKKIFLTLFLIISQLSIFILFYGNPDWTSPRDKQFSISHNFHNNFFSGILVPLDSRPPCLEFAAKLAEIGGIHLVSPPKYLLDNYRAPAQTKALRQWLYNSISRSTDFAILSSDMLMHGGLIASRDIHKADDRAQDFLSLLAAIQQKNPQTSLAAFTIIPRLLIAENDDTKTWQYHMQQYAILKDKVNTFENPLDYAALEKVQLLIPPELIKKYNNIYLYNDNFNKNLLKLFDNKLLDKLIIGQDDGEAFGLPNTNRHKAELYLDHLTNAPARSAYTTRGADEIAQLFIAQYVIERYQTKPKIYIQYSQPQTKDTVMPYMPSSVDETVREKIKIINAEITEDKDLADFIIYIHCGNEQTNNFLSLYQICSEVKALTANYNVALIDLSQNFEEQETLVSGLILQDVPLPKLIAYAGWNTTSNSVGTALSQASIFTVRKKNLPTSEHLPLYYANTNFTLSRIIEDWGYLKNILPKINSHLKLSEVDNYHLGNNKAYTEDLIRRDVQALANNLLYKNFSRHPFYVNKHAKFFIRNIVTEASLPWERTFEINLNIQTSVMQKKY